MHGLYPDLYKRARADLWGNPELISGIYVYADLRELIADLLLEPGSSQCHVELVSGYINWTGRGVGKAACTLALKPESSFVVGIFVKKNLLQTFPLRVPEQDRLSLLVPPSGSRE